MQLKPNMQKVPASQHSVFPDHHLRCFNRFNRILNCISCFWQLIQFKMPLYRHVQNYRHVQCAVFNVQITKNVLGTTSTSSWEKKFRSKNFNNMQKLKTCFLYYNFTILHCPSIFIIKMYNLKRRNVSKINTYIKSAFYVYTVCIEQNAWTDRAAVWDV